MSSTTPLPDWDAIYRGDEIYTGFEAPWNIGEPQPAIADLITTGRITSPVLDAGCGVGITTAALAERGYEVVGLDASPAAVEQATALTHDQGVRAEIAVADLSDLSGYEGRFATVVDSAVFHSMPVASRRGYLESIVRSTTPGARFYALVFDQDHPFPDGMAVYGFSADELRATVEPYLTVENIEQVTMTDIVPEGVGDQFDTDAEGRRLYPAWLLTATRA